MLEMILWALIIFLLALAAFYGLCFLVALWSGCSIEEAAVKVQNLFGRKAAYQFENDNSFAEKIWENVQEIIGDAKYQKLCALSKTAITTPLLWHGMDAGLPYIGICVPYKDNAEKIVLENLLVNAVKTYLKLSNYFTDVVTVWRVRQDIQMPYIMIKYSRTEKDHALLLDESNRIRNKLVLPNLPVTDDEEIEDLL